MAMNNIKLCPCPFCNLKKPVFNIKDYPGKYVMHVKSEEEAKVFCEYLHVMKKLWRTGKFYCNETYFANYGDLTIYYFNDGSYGNMTNVNHPDFETGYTILEFDDFDWSDFTMKKEFTKKDLKNGDVVKLSDDTIGIVCLDTNTIIYRDGFDRLSDLDNDLTFIASLCNTRIVAVRRPLSPDGCQFIAFDRGFGYLVYERKEVEEMTLEEVCKALGKEIKIVKEKN